MFKKFLFFGLPILILLIVIIALVERQKENNSLSSNNLIPGRESKIPTNANKITPETDVYPPILHSNEYENLVPLAVINTAGAEDSTFISVDSNELYFFFTPDVKIPPEKQLLDDVTGIYVSQNINGAWQKPERILLQDSKKLALDGCEFVQDNKMWFCSAREGYAGINWFTAEYKNGKWANWGNADFKKEYEVGELHIFNDELYFHSARPGGKGGNDIWVSKNANGEWQEPQNAEAVNTGSSEGWPYITADGKELWFNREYKGAPAIFKSKRANGVWQTPELIISQFAGEPTLDKNGNIYFVHHFFKDNQMLEADIYVAYKKQ